MYQITGRTEKVVYFWGKEMRLVGKKLVSRPAYRPKNSGKYGEQTVRMRIPVSLVPAITELLKKYEEIEKAKRIIKSNFAYNTVKFKKRDAQ